MRNEVNLYQINKDDNVAVALCDLNAGITRVRGDTELERAPVAEKIDSGHKLAIKDIHAGENIIKYGVVIGVAIKEIKRGEWVHLHNIKSKFDEKSSSLDLKTGVSTKIRYF